MADPKAQQTRLRGSTPLVLSPGSLSYYLVYLVRAVLVYRPSDTRPRVQEYVSMQILVIIGTVTNRCKTMMANQKHDHIIIANSRMLYIR